MKKISCVLAVILMLSMVCCACSQDMTGAKEDASGNAESLTDLSFLLTFREMEETETEQRTEPVTDRDESGLTPEKGVSYFYWDQNSPNENTTPLVYDGSEITLYHVVTANEEFNKKYVLMINGIEQDAQVTRDGKDVGSIHDFILELDEGDTAELTFRFSPNTGNTGDMLTVYLMAIGYPEYYCVPGGYISGNRFIDQSGMFSWTFLEYFGCLRMEMNADADTDTAVCTDYSGMTQGSISQDVYDTFDGAIDPMGNPDTSWLQEKHTAILINGSELCNCEPSKETTVTVRLYGQAQKCRIHVTLNGQLLTPFNGLAYADISVDDGNQTDVTFTIDTSELGSLNNLCIYSMPLDTDEPYYLVEPSIQRMTLYVK